MRPIKLTMSAFGPYAGETVVDFDKLGENGIYLISGDTGAGKTTIFDGIVYALYGEASGEKREVSMLRSKYAQPETPTFAELVFKYADKLYTVRRNPAYMRKKLKGEGYTAQSADCSFTYPDGRVITKKTEVDNAVKDTIGISKDQFLQIAMIAQGDFLKTLTASTDKRKEILRLIFKTGRFFTLQARLKTEAGEAKKRVEIAREGIQQYIEGIRCSDKNPLALNVERAKNKELPLVDVIVTLEKLVKEDEISDKELSGEIAEIEKQLAQVNSLLGKLEEYNKANTELLSVSKAINSKSDELVKAKEILDSEKEKFKETEMLNKESAEIRAELPRYSELEAQSKKIESTQKLLKNDEKSLSDKNKLLDVKRETLEKLKAEKSTLEKAGENREKLISEKNTAEEKKKNLEALRKTLNEYTSMLSDLEEKQIIFIEARNYAQQALDAYNSKNQAFLNEQAGILALQLKENSPCPVCGSTVHPSIAQKSETAPTEEELKKAKQNSDKAQSEAANASNVCAVIKGKAETAKSNIENQLEKLIGDSDINSSKEKIFSLIKEESELIAKLNSEIAAEEKKIKRKSELETIIPKTESETEKLKNDISSIETNIASYKASLAEIAEQLNLLKSSLCFTDKNAAEKKISELESKAEILKKSFDNAQNVYNACEKDIIALKARQEQLKKQLDSSEKINADEVTEKKNTLNSQKQAKTEMKTEVLARLMSNRSALENIKKKTDEINLLEKRESIICSLNDTANGHINGKERIMLETYIQMTYFDRIIERANTRFMIMSGGQYELKRSQTAENLKSSEGLSLDVIDHYNGTQRSVKTLSGGESFKASLSLALGLSDEIQASAGGVRLDTMFVDEGFGSLDDESLNQAMNALKGLTEGNRLVGIISHVNELKERIDKQIIVTKDKLGGSRIKIVT
ncbi:MAG: AAA family ATPase [Ruminococcus sp.]